MWIQLASVVAGIWLMAAPTVLGYGNPAANLDRVLGPTAVAIAIIAVSQVTRSVRWANLPIGVALVALPWILGYPTAALISSTVSGLVICAAAIFPGRIDKQFGGGWRELVRPGI